MKSPRFLLAAFCVAYLNIFGPSSLGATVSEARELAPAFAYAGVTGTFAMLDPADGSVRVYDASRAAARFVPASTFKIPNTLIGLDCGAVADVDEVFPYDGGERCLEAWKEDMGLREAIRVSNVPVYQELARRIGLKRMRAAVESFGYGNHEIGNVVDRFWLDGPLAISALEQVDFLRRLTNGELPVQPESLAAVREITLLEETDAFALHGKTGWTGAGTANEPGIGWFVGWIETDGRTYPFALNIDLDDQALLDRRQAVARECLRLLGVL